MNSFLKHFALVLGLSLLFLNLPVRAADSMLGKDAVVSSIKPVHSLVEAVLGESGSSLLLIDGSASMHNYQLKPSQQRALSFAKVVFFIDGNAETFLEKAFTAGESTGRLVPLAEDPSIQLLKKRRGDDWQQHSHDEVHAHGSDEKDTHQEHGNNVDLHIWLNPQNALLMLRNIERVLTEVFPDNAAIFSSNADAVSEKLQQLDAELEGLLLPLKERPFIVFHDAYGYFEKRYSLKGVGSVVIDTSLSPSVSQMQTVRKTIESTQAVCVFSEPQFSEKIISVVVEGKHVRTARVDPLGATIDAGASHYFELMRNLALDFDRCLGT